MIEIFKVNVLCITLQILLGFSFCLIKKQNNPIPHKGILKQNRPTLYINTNIIIKSSERKILKGKQYATTYKHHQHGIKTIENFFFHKFINFINQTRIFKHPMTQYS